MTIGGDDSRNLFPTELTARLDRRRFIGGIGAAAFAAAFLAACSGDEEPESTSTPTGTATTDATTEATSSPTASASPEATEQAAYPVTIEHAAGSTTIEARPQRIVTLGDFQDLDYVLNFGGPVVLYGFTNAWDSGNMPWQAEGVADVESWDATGEIDLEQIAAAQPDLIVGMISGEEVYEQLSDIAPTILIDWGTTWRDGIRWIGAALGESEQAETDIAETEGKLAAATSQLEALGDQSVMVGFQYGETFYIWGEEATAALVLSEMGVNFVGGPEPSLTPASLEQANLMDGADIVLSVDSDPAGLAIQEASPIFQSLPAVQAGKYDVLPVRVSRALGDGFSPLSVDWAIEQSVEILNRVAAGNGKQLG